MFWEFIRERWILCRPDDTNRVWLGEIKATVLEDGTVLFCARSMTPAGLRLIKKDFSTLAEAKKWVESKGKKVDLRA